MHIIQTPLFDFEAFIAKKDNDRLAMVLEALPAEGLISALEKDHWTGRKGYSIRGMWSARDRIDLPANPRSDECAPAPVA
jgi:hypothetical protein